MRPEDFAFARGIVAPTYKRHRQDCRLMVVDRKAGTIQHKAMSDLESFIAGDEVWANNSFDISKPDQTYHPVYATYAGSHATPSAGLFLNAGQVERLKVKLLTLHISGPRGQETSYQSGFSSNVGWREWYTIPGRPNGGVTAIGTTVVKALETWVRTGQTEGWTSLFIQPPFEFRAIRKLLTNFHFPQETLLALTCAFGGIDLIREAYEAAVAEQYLFSCYGDRLLII